MCSDPVFIHRRFVCRHARNAVQKGGVDGGISSASTGTEDTGTKWVPVCGCVWLLCMALMHVSVILQMRLVYDELACSGKKGISLCIQCGCLVWRWLRLFKVASLSPSLLVFISFSSSVQLMYVGAAVMDVVLQLCSVSSSERVVLFECVVQRIGVNGYIETSSWLSAAPSHSPLRRRCSLWCALLCLRINCTLSVALFLSRDHLHAWTFLSSSV